VATLSKREITKELLPQQHQPDQPHLKTNSGVIKGEKLGKVAQI
jgi:hypothetical protein